MTKKKNQIDFTQMALILSVNVNGLRNIKKRQNVLHWFDIKRLIQDTHYESKQTENEWLKDWKGKRLSSYGTILSKGVTVLFHEKAIINNLSFDIREDRRMISVKTEIYDQKLQIINIDR